MRLLAEIHQRICNQPEATALTGAECATSFGKLGRRVQAVLNLLAREHTNAPLVVTGHKEPDAVAAMLACMFAGRPFVFVDRSNPPARAARISEICGATVALCAGEVPDLGGLPAVCLGDLEDQRPTGALLPVIDPETVLYVVFTSGSTGEPKGVVVSRANFDAFREWYVSMLENLPGQELSLSRSAHVNHASLSFDMGMLDLWPVLSIGRPVIMLDHRNNVVPRNNLNALTAILEIGARSWFSTPSLLQIMCADPGFNSDRLPDMRCFFVGGEVVQQELLRDLARRFPNAELRHAYGPSEVTCLTHVYTLTDKELQTEGPLPLGAVLGPNTMRIVDQNGNDVAPGERGEVEFSGPQVVSGYIPADHPASRSLFSRRGERVYRTGDFGRTDASGALIFLGRIDRQIKWNGNRIELDEIERAANLVEGVQRAICSPVKENGRVVDLVLFVKCRSDASLTHPALMAALSERLPQPMIPRDVRFVDHIPMTVNGKLDTKTMQKASVADASSHAELVE